MELISDANDPHQIVEINVRFYAFAYNPLKLTELIPERRSTGVYANYPRSEFFPRIVLHFRELRSCGDWCRFLWFTASGYQKNCAQRNQTLQWSVHYFPSCPVSVMMSDQLRFLAKQFELHQSFDRHRLRIQPPQMLADLSTNDRKTPLGSQA